MTSEGMAGHSKGGAERVEDESQKAKEEVESIKRNWRSIQEFLKDINTREMKQMDKETRQIIVEMKLDMSKLLDINKLKEEGHVEMVPGASETIMKNKCGKPEKDKGREKLKEKQTVEAVIKTEVDELTGSSAESNSGTEYEESSSDSITKEKQYKSKAKSTRRKRKQSTTSGSDTVGSEENVTLKAFQKFTDKVDLRPVPKLEPFDEESGQSLNQYLVMFEDYCKANYRKSRR